MAEIIERGSFDRERLAAAAGGGHSYATDYCDLLTLRHRIPNGEAHKVIGRAIRAAIEGDREFISEDDLALAENELGIEVPRLDQSDLEVLHDPVAIAGSRNTLGGASRQAMGTQLAGLDERLRAHSEHLGQARARVVAAEHAVLDAAANLARL